VDSDRQAHPTPAEKLKDVNEQLENRETVLRHLSNNGFKKYKPIISRASRYWCRSGLWSHTGETIAAYGINAAYGYCIPKNDH